MTTQTTPARALGLERGADGVLALSGTAIQYEDGAEAAVLALVASASDLGSDSVEMLHAADGWAMRYHVDPARANVIRAFDLPPDSRVLEVGAGCGAITRYLGETAAHVDALEPMRARAAVARERTRDLANVEVFAGEVDQLPDAAAYDVIVVVGVLEYVGGGSADREPYVDFLSALQRRLASGGRLLLAIENKLGVKYLAGSPEDHTGRLFDGLEGYPRGTHARTFSRSELSSLLSDAGFAPHILGAFPDYKTTRVVLDFDEPAGDALEVLYRIPSFPSPDAGTSRVRLVDEGLLWRELVEAEVGSDFPNSFVVVAGAAPDTGIGALWPEGTLARFFSRDRHPSAVTETTVRRDGGAVRFLRTFAADPLPQVSAENPVAPFVPGRPFDEVFADGDDEVRSGLLGEWIALVESSVDERGVPIDAIPQNVRVDASGDLHLIDVEFRSPTLPVSTVIERGILWLGVQLGTATAPELWSQYGRIRELVVGLGTLAGLPDTGSWLAGAIVAEAAFQSDVTSRFAGSDAENSWQEELHRVLDSDLSSGRLGLRATDQLHAAEGRVSELHDELLHARTEIARRRAEHASALADALETVTGLETELVATSAVVTELELTGREREFILRNTQDELEEIRVTSSRLLHESRDEAARARTELHALHSSRAFRALAFSRGRLDAVAPWGTHRRGVYERSLRGLGRAVRLVRRPHPVEPPRVPMPYSETPVVSIVIPIHGKWAYTEQCLLSLARCYGGEQLEIIVVDDASPDDSLARLTHFDGVRVVTLTENVGFTRAANAGIAAARGRDVVMLNNDAEVTPGWLAALLDAAALPDAGVVGAKLVYPDGRLQEAGGIIFRDASGWNYGRYGDPDAPEYNMRRDVDYCSGAAILITEALREKVGGFDERYAPAYYEDTDLAFEARRHGLRVIYEPRSVVVHHEGVSHGTDESSGLKHYQVLNQRKFLEKWSKELLHQSENSPIAAKLAASRRSDRKTIVIVDHMVPRWREDSGSLRMFRLITTLMELGYDIVFLPDNRDPAQPYTAELQRLGVLVWYGWSDIWAHLEGISETVALVLLCRATVASAYIRHVREVLPEVPIAFDTVDLHFLREQRRLEMNLGGNIKSVTAMRELELAIVRSSDLTLVVSEYEREVLTELEPASSVFVLSNSHDSVPISSPLPRTEITFVGSFQHTPNADAIRWFVREVFPRVRDRIPAAHLSVVGLFPPSDLVDEGHEGVEFLGWVEDLEPVHARSLISVAPLRYGAGVKGKVGDAWAHGVPVVMTSLAAEGMRVEHGRTGLIADTSEDFAAAIVRLHRDEALWDLLSTESRIHVDEVFGRARLVAALGEVLSFVPAPPTSDADLESSRSS
jgi:GT2 family glycosyltransferase/SAM-dependent methyltransferase